MDTRHLVAGTTLYLPVFVAGANLSMGDGHATQGDGEVCGTAIETPMRATVRVTARNDLHVTGPEFEAAPDPWAGRTSISSGCAGDPLSGRWNPPAARVARAMVCTRGRCG